MLQHDYLSERMLKGLSAYKYTASGHTWLDRLHDPMWDAAVARLPRWLAPNAITFAGTLCMIVAHHLLMFYAPELDGASAPAWVHWFAFFSVLIYVNLDCMDGKQARRTKSSSPLGQLFDHGCDALVTGVLIVNVASSVGMQLSPKMALMMFAPLALWILGQWEEYHTGARLTRPVHDCVPSVAHPGLKGPQSKLSLCRPHEVRQRLLWRARGQLRARGVPPSVRRVRRGHLAPAPP